MFSVAALCQRRIFLGSAVIDRRYSQQLRNNLGYTWHSFVIRNSSFGIFLTPFIDIVQPERP
jgi:hypothetical protein